MFSVQCTFYSVECRIYIYIYTYILHSVVLLTAEGRRLPRAAQKHRLSKKYGFPVAQGRRRATAVRSSYGRGGAERR